MRPNVSMSRRKQRKEHFGSHSDARQKLMSAPLSKELQEKYNVRSLPVRRDDEVMISTGSFKNREGKITNVYRRRWVVHVERITRNKANGTAVPVGLAASNLVITKLKLDKDRKALLEKKSKSKGAKEELNKMD